MIAMTFDITTISMALTGAGALCAFTAGALGLWPMRRTARCRVQPIQQPDEEEKSPPMISVVVHSHNRAEQIIEYLDVITAQKYPRFEVIVVNDSGADDNTVEIVETYALMHPNVYCTFLPLKSYNVSRRKMALTLGIKAAKGEVILTTSSACLPQSDLWLAAIGRHFASPGIDIVAGYAHTPFDRMKGFGKWYRSFDSVCRDSQWIGYALAGKAYRADGLNLAFRRELFFKNKGYADTAFMQDGDDDLFLADIATRNNVAVEINPESQLLRTWHRSEYKLWRDRKERYSFTARFLHTSAFMLSRFYKALTWLVPACVATAIALDPVSLSAIIAGALIILLFWGYQICLYRRTAKQLQSPRLWWSVPVFSLFRPLSDAWYGWKFGGRRSDYLTWAPRK